MNKKALWLSQTISRELAENGAEAVVLMGSFARGDARVESDLDIHAIGKGARYRLERRQGFLVSISWSTSKRERHAFKDPSKAGKIVPAWRNAAILNDPTGIAKAIKQEAIDWKWDSLGKRAERWVAEELTGWAEEVHRLVGNLRFEHLSVAAVQRSLLAISMARILAVHHQMLYDTENQLWDIVSKKMGKNWEHLQMAALGTGDQSFKNTCKAALRLFAATAKEVKQLMDKRQYDVVANACRIAGYPLL
ncbi:MAG TPA: nucleotidyltransferase domain-containing protein [Candidatus Bathyarchaeia archaeon]|nr:nucleotidyltransferase domain-containing protein [Candidatus Bathyarchaeia archaeon]